MMARSTARSNQRPDTLMQDRKPTDRRNSLATHGRTIHCGLKILRDGTTMSGSRGKCRCRRIAPRFERRREPRRRFRRMPEPNSGDRCRRGCRKIAARCPDVPSDQIECWRSPDYHDFTQRPDHGECYAGYGNSGEARDQCSPRGPVRQTQHHVLWDGLAAVTFVGRRQFPFTVLGPNIVSIGLSGVCPLKIAVNAVLTVFRQM